MSTAGPRFANFYRILDEPREHGAIGRGIRVLIGVLLATVLVHTLTAVVLFDDARLLSKAAETELGWVESRNPATADGLSRRMDASHGWLFRRTGIEQLALTTRNSLGTSLARTAREVYHGLAASIQLLTLRVGILALSLPLLGVLIIVAVVEGWSNWYLRRQNGARESSFLYHRFKKAVKLALLVMLVVYLVPPIPIDPVWAFLPFFSVTAAGLATAVSLFKKHL